jgi:hypothetical protein
MVNVPAGVWIDEQGRIVRPAEVAYSRGMSLMGQKLGDDRYAAGLKDWVRRGKESPWAMPRARLDKRLAVAARERRSADAHFKLGGHFQALGERALAKKHWAEAQRLAPENWNYHRQDWSFDGPMGGLKWLKKVQELKGKPYYKPIDLPQAPSEGPSPEEESSPPPRQEAPEAKPRAPLS